MVVPRLRRAMARLAHPLAAAVLAPLVAGHGTMTYPPSRAKSTMQLGSMCDSMDPTTNGTCLWFNQGCAIGCPECTGTGKVCKDTMKPTLTDPKLRTYPNEMGVDFTKSNPWRAPGFAPIAAPCGIAGGWWNVSGAKNMNRGDWPPMDIPMGFDMRKMPKNTYSDKDHKYEEIVWKAGSVQEVAWGFVANHGGGYAYRLCPAASELTEECFQSHHLQFVGEQSWIQYGEEARRAAVGPPGSKYEGQPLDIPDRKAISATRVSQGTNPAGSMWTKNPIPACSGPVGGGVHTPCNKPQFEPPLPGLFGFGGGHCQFPLANCCKGEGCVCKPACNDEEGRALNQTFVGLNIVDQIQVPTDLAPGDYAISFRWDCEQSPQIWAQCGDVRVTA